MTNYRGFLGSSVLKNPPARDTGDPNSVPGSGRSPGVGNGNSLQYSCLENAHELRSLAQSIGVTKNQTLLSDSAQHAKETRRNNFSVCFSVLKLVILFYFQFNKSYVLFN